MKTLLLSSLTLAVGCNLAAGGLTKFTLVDPATAPKKPVQITSAQLQDLRALTDRRIAEIRATPSRLAPVGVPCRYLSEKSGSDAADGKTPATAWKTIARLNKENLKSGTWVLFERGGLYRGCVLTKPRCTYTAYGAGAKPRIYGSPVNGGDPAKWERTDNPRVWAYTIGYDDVGTMVFDDGAQHAIKIVIRTDRKTGKKFNKFTNCPFESYRNLDGDLHFWHDYYTNGTGKVYLCSERNPAERFKSIEFNVKTCGFRVGGNSNVTIDNFCIKYVGVHGVAAGTCAHLTVSNCEFGWIGGSIQGETLFGRDHPTRLGNAVEIYGGCDVYCVTNNYIWQCYDAGITQQVGIGTDRKLLRNQRHMRYTDNVIEKCNYSIEYFLSCVPDGNPSRMEDFVIENNLMWDAAVGFCEQRPDHNQGAHVKSWTNPGNRNRAKDYTIRNNLFCGSREMLVQISAGLRNLDGSDSMPKLEGNLFAGRKGQRLGVINQGKPVDLPYTEEGIARIGAPCVNNVYLYE